MEDQKPRKRRSSILKSQNVAASAACVVQSQEATTTVGLTRRVSFAEIRLAKPFDEDGNRSYTPQKEPAYFDASHESSTSHHGHSRPESKMSLTECIPAASFSTNANGQQSAYSVESMQETNVVYTNNGHLTQLSVQSMQETRLVESSRVSPQNATGDFLRDVMLASTPLPRASSHAAPTADEADEPSAMSLDTAPLADAADHSVDVRRLWSRADASSAAAAMDLTRRSVTPELPGDGDACRIDDGQQTLAFLGELRAPPPLPPTSEEAHITPSACTFYVSSELSPDSTAHLPAQSAAFLSPSPVVLQKKRRIYSPAVKDSERTTADQSRLDASAVTSSTSAMEVDMEEVDASMEATVSNLRKKLLETSALFVASPCAAKDSTTLRDRTSTVAALEDESPFLVDSTLHESSVRSLLSSVDAAAANGTFVVGEPSDDSSAADETMRVCEIEAPPIDSMSHFFPGVTTDVGDGSTEDVASKLVSACLSQYQQEAASGLIDQLTSAVERLRQRLTKAESKVSARVVRILQEGRLDELTVDERTRWQASVTEADCEWRAFRLKTAQSLLPALTGEVDDFDRFDLMMQGRVQVTDDQLDAVRNQAAAESEALRHISSAALDELVADAEQLASRRLALSELDERAEELERLQLRSVATRLAEASVQLAAVGQRVEAHRQRQRDEQRRRDELLVADKLDYQVLRSSDNVLELAYWRFVINVCWSDDSRLLSGLDVQSVFESACTAAEDARLFQPFCSAMFGQPPFNDVDSLLEKFSKDDLPMLVNELLRSLRKARLIYADLHSLFVESGDFQFDKEGIARVAYTSYANLLQFTLDIRINFANHPLGTSLVATQNLKALSIEDAQIAFKAALRAHPSLKSALNSVFRP